MLYFVAIDRLLVLAPWELHDVVSLSIGGTFQWSGRNVGGDPSVWQDGSHGEHTISSVDSTHPSHFAWQDVESPFCLPEKRSRKSLLIWPERCVLQTLLMYIDFILFKKHLETIWAWASHCLALLRCSATTIPLQKPQWLAFLSGEVGDAISTVHEHCRKPHTTETIKAGRI